MSVSSALRPSVEVKDWTRDSTSLLCLDCLQLNIDEFTTANVMGKSFYATMKTCIDPQWHLLSGKTRRSIGDLKNLKKLME